MIGVPLVSVLGLLQCNICVSDMDSGIERTLNLFASTRLCGTVNTHMGKGCHPEGPGQTY